MEELQQRLRAQLLPCACAAAWQLRLLGCPISCSRLAWVLAPVVGVAVHPLLVCFFFCFFFFFFASSLGELGSTR